MDYTGWGRKDLIGGSGSRDLPWLPQFHPTPRPHTLPDAMTSTVVFPAHTADQIESMSSISVLSRQATALEICDMVYGNKAPSWEAIEHYYESSASECLVPKLLT